MANCGPNPVCQGDIGLVSAYDIRITGCGANIVCLLTRDGRIYRISEEAFRWLDNVVPRQLDEAEGIRSLGIGAKDLVYDRLRDRLYASVAGQQGLLGNSVLTIDPAQARLVSRVQVGSQPNHLALSSDSSCLYITLDAGLVQPYDTATQRLLPRFFVGLNAAGFSLPSDIAVRPGNPGTIAVGREDTVNFSPARDAIVFDEGKPRPKTSLEDHPRNTPCSMVEFLEDGDTAVCASTQVSFFSLLADGLHLRDSIDSVVHRSSMRYVSGRVFLSDGTIIDVASRSVTGKVELPPILFGGNSNSSHAVLPLTNENRIYYLSGSYEGIEVSAFELSTLRRLRSLPLPGLDGPATVMADCGANCIAIAGRTRIFFLRKDLFEAQ